MSSKTNFQNNILDVVVKTINENELVNKGDKILVALSGGADSVCLLDVMCKLRNTYSVEVAAAHLNHMIRGSEADRDEAYAAELCTVLEVPFYAERVDVPKLAEELKISEELAGRKARYDFFERVCQKHGYTLIATAHNKNDRAETVLMRMIRGTGIDGLGSIKYKRGSNIIRPILDLDRKSIEEYCEENNLRYCTDSTNFKNDYTRNKVRNLLIPMIEENFNPNIIETLCNLADNSADDSEFINGYAERLYRRINSPLPKRKPTVLDIKSMQMLDDCIASRLIRIASREVMGREYKLERTHVRAVSNLLDKDTGASADLPMGLKVSVKYGWLEFLSPDDEENAKSSLHTGFCYEFEVNDGDDVSLPQVSIQVTELPLSYKLDKNRMIVDFDGLEDKELCIRSRKIGDRITLYKDGKSKSLKDYFIDIKIPRSERDKIPLLCSGKEVIAVIGHRVAENRKINKNTRKGLVITYGTEYENRQNND